MRGHHWVHFLQNLMSLRIFANKFRDKLINTKMKHSVLALVWGLLMPLCMWAETTNDSLNIISNDTLISLPPINGDSIDYTADEEVIPDSIWAQDTVRTGTPLYKFAHSPHFRNANISVLVKEIKTGKQLAEYRSVYNMIPASVTKVISTASALEILSDTFRFRTKLEYDGEIQNGVLNGNLYITGGGDPTLASTNSNNKTAIFANFLAAVKKKGITKINGKIVGDASLYEEEGGPGIWLVEDIGSAYSPTPSALSFYDNLITFTMQSDNQNVKLSNVTPSTRLFQPKLDIDVLAGNVTSKVTQTDYSWTPLVSGRMKPNSKHGIRIGIPDPAHFVADSMLSTLKKAGISVNGTATTQRLLRASAPRKTLAVYKSATLGEICKPTNYKSINLYAENIFSQVGLKKERPSTKTASADVIAKYWKKKGLSSNTIFQMDGSGLSMKNAINSAFLVEVLSYMYTKSKYKKTFYESLPVCGVSGTVKYLLDKTPLAGKVHAKSGSMERVQNYCGYIEQEGRAYAFCVMINNFAGPRASVKAEISRLLNGVMAEEAALYQSSTEAIQTQASDEVQLPTENTAPEAEEPQQEENSNNAQ